MGIILLCSLRCSISREACAHCLSGVPFDDGIHPQNVLNECLLLTADIRGRVNNSEILLILHGFPTSSFDFYLVSHNMEVRNLCVAAMVVPGVTFFLNLIL